MKVKLRKLKRLNLIQRLIIILPTPFKSLTCLFHMNLTRTVINRISRTLQPDVVEPLADAQLLSSAVTVSFSLVDQ